MRTKLDIQLEAQEKRLWAEEYARIDAEYNALMLEELKAGRSKLEAAERAWARGEGQ